MVYGRIRDFVAARRPLTADAHVDRIGTTIDGDKNPVLGCARIACRAVTRILRRSGAGLISAGSSLLAAADFADGVALWTEVIESGALSDLERAEIADLLDDDATYSAGGEASIVCPVRSCGANAGDPCTDRGLVRRAPHASRVERWLGKVQADELASVMGAPRAEDPDPLAATCFECAGGIGPLCRSCSPPASVFVDGRRFVSEVA